MLKKTSSSTTETTRKTKKNSRRLRSGDVYANAEDDIYGRVRQPNFHDSEHHNHRRRCRFFDLSTSKGNNNDDCCYYSDDPHAIVTRLRPMLPSPFRELSYKSRTGWRYNPASRNTPFLDRLGTGIAETAMGCYGSEFNSSKEHRTKRRKRHKTQTKGGKTNENDERSKNNNNNSDDRFVLAAPLPMPSTTMIIPVSWTSGLPSETVETFSQTVTRFVQKKRAQDRPDELNPQTKKRKTSVNWTIEDKPTLRKMKLPRSMTGNRDTLLDNNASTIVTNSTNGDAASLRPPKRVEGLSKTNPKDKIGATKTNPKEKIYTWYATKQRKVFISAKQYMVWENGQKHHQVRFAAIFFCPMTNEAFLAGPLNPERTRIKNTSTTVNPEGLYWFRGKKTAEHAAAARAWDCLSMRKGLVADSKGLLGTLEPYWPSQRPKWPLSELPATVLEKLSPEQRSGAQSSSISSTAGVSDTIKNNNEVATTTQKTSKTETENSSSQTVESDKEKKSGKVAIPPSKNRLNTDNSSTKQKRAPGEWEQRKFRAVASHRFRSQVSSAPKNYDLNYDDPQSRSMRAVEVDHYRAQRMHYDQHNTIHYPPRREPGRATGNNFSHSTHARIGGTHQNGRQQLGSTFVQLGQHPVPQTQAMPQAVPEYNHTEFTQRLHQQIWYPEQQQQPDNNNLFRFPANVRNDYNHQYNRNQQENYHSLPLPPPYPPSPLHQDHPQLPPLPPPPLPPPPLPPPYPPPPLHQDHPQLPPLPPPPPPPPPPI